MSVYLARGPLQPRALGRQAAACLACSAGFSGRVGIDAAPLATRLEHFHR